MKPEVASRRIESFGQRFGEAHLYLAYHAAFPLALTPDLLYRLWANFQLDIHRHELKIPWLAVADLLLSSLCDEVGHELYEMDTAVRNALLKELKENPRFGEKRINELSDFLLTYVQQQLESHDPDMRDFAQAQRWTALAYTRPGEAARELALTLSKLKLEEKAEWVRIASLVETFTEPLADFQPLLFYSRGMQNFARGNLESASAEFSNLSDIDKYQVDVAGVKLPIPEQITNFIEEPKYIIKSPTNINYSQKSPTARILVVDDVQDNLILINSILEDEGYEIYLAADGKTALTQVEQSPPDLIILDVKMPEMDGYEVTRRIRNNHVLPYIPILLISAFVESNVVEGLDTGADDFIRKPIDIDELLARVRSLLRLKKMIGKRDQIEDGVESNLYNLQNSRFNIPPFIRTYEDAIKDIKVKVRLYDIAKELNADNRDIMAICKSLGIEVKSHSSTISNTDVQRIRAAFSNYLKASVQSFSTEPITKIETSKDELIFSNGLDCSVLREFLTIKRWQEADQETARLIISITGAQRQGWLGVEELKNFSCQNLRTIDQLWVKYSNGNFGFSVQKKIWESLGFADNVRDYYMWWSFGDLVEWRVKDRWLPYERIQFTSQAPKGHLPFFRAWIGMRKTGLVHSMHQVNRFHAFMYRCAFCNLTQ